MLVKLQWSGASRELKSPRARVSTDAQPAHPPRVSPFLDVHVSGTSASAPDLRATARPQAAAAVATSNSPLRLSESERVSCLFGTQCLLHCCIPEKRAVEHTSEAGMRHEHSSGRCIG